MSNTALSALDNINLKDFGDIVKATIDVQDQPVNVITPDLIDDIDALRDSFPNKTILFASDHDKIFVAGADVKDFAVETDPDKIREFSKRAQDCFHRLSTHKGTISLINGFALGGGYEVTMATQARLATPNAVIGQVEVDIGVIPGFDGHQRMAELVGPKAAALLAATGAKLNAEQAERLGLVDAIVSGPEEAKEKIAEFANSGGVQREKPTIDPEALSKTLDEYRKLLDAHKKEQDKEIEEIKASPDVADQHVANIQTVMNATYSARRAALDVVEKQAKVTSRGQKSRIEQDAFIEIATTPEAKLAIQFNLLDKKGYAAEHAIIKGSKTLRKHGLEGHLERLLAPKP